MQTRRESRKCKVSLWVAIFALLLVFSLPASAIKETMIVIADEPNHAYEKPEVRISPVDGAIYIVYRDKNNVTGESDIILKKYANNQLTLIKNVSESAPKSYEPEIDITKDGTIHIAWCDQTGDRPVIRYRKFNGTTWSQTINLAESGGYEYVDDIRMAADPSNNVFCVFMFVTATEQVASRYASLYNGKVTLEQFPTAGRNKHTSVAVDKNNIHMAWQYPVNQEYTIAYSKRPNKSGSKWEKVVYLGYDGLGRPRIGLDEKGIAHVMFHHNYGSIRDLYYQKWVGTKFGELTILSVEGIPETYHYYDMRVIDESNMIVTAQRGGGEGGRDVVYNWKKAGKWSGLDFVKASAGLRPVRQSVDLFTDRIAAAFVFAAAFSSVHLVIAEEEGSGVNLPTAAFSLTPPSGSTPLTVNFDATTSTDAGGSIIGYRWNFGDGTVGTGKTVSHVYTEAGSYPITLTVFDNEYNIDTATATLQVVTIMPPLSVTNEITENRGFLFREYVGKVTWAPNPGNVSNDIDVVKYNIYRKLSTDTAYTLIGSMTHSAATTLYTYYDRFGKERKEYLYAVTAVDPDGAESNYATPAPAITLSRSHSLKTIK